MIDSRRRLWIVALLGAFVPLGCAPERPDSGAARQPAPTATEEAVPRGKPFAVVETEKGPIVIELLEEAAPKTVANFIELAEVGFYTRTTFHRVMKGKMIQGGDPLSRDNDPYNDGQGTSGKYIPAEFSSLKFEPGTVAMARQPGDPNTASCQFFIVLERAPAWDNEYTVFGKVVQGLEIAEQISAAPLSKVDHPAMKLRPAGKQLIKEVRIDYR